MRRTTTVATRGLAMRSPLVAVALGLALALALPAGVVRSAPDGKATGTPVGTGGTGAAIGPPREFTPEELKALDELEQDAKHYEEMARDHQRRLNEIVQREKRARIKQINERYKRGCLTADAEYLKRHGEGMGLLLAFLEKYPNDPKWTPDVKFRLATLHIDQATLDWNVREKVKPCSDLDEKAIVRAPIKDGTLPDAGVVEEPESEVTAEVEITGPDFSAAIKLWREIVKDFPEYRLIDLTLYALAYYLSESGMEKAEDAKRAYQALVCFNKYGDKVLEEAPVDTSREACPAVDPKATLEDIYTGCVPAKEGSALVDEGWQRVGDAHFFARCEIPAAIAAYSRVVAAGEQSGFYDGGLYMLGWSYYRVNRYDEAIAAFDKFVVLSDKLAAEAGDSEGLDLRKEAVTYLAISLSDPWPTEDESTGNPAKALARAAKRYSARMTEKHVRDIYEELGNVIRQTAGSPGEDGVIPEDMGVAYQQAITAWRVALANWPLHPRNPVVHQQIVDLLELLGDNNAEMTERQQLADAYKKGSDWYRANEMNRDAMALASRLGEDSLIKAAYAVHRKAQDSRAAWEAEVTEKTKAAVIAELGGEKAVKKMDPQELQDKIDEQARKDLLQQQDAAGRVAYKQLYDEAAKLYNQYLTTYPTSMQVPKLVYRRADCLYFSDQFDEAVDQYRWVRDHRTLIDKKTWDNASKRIVEARETALAQALAKNPALQPADPTPDSLKAAPTPMPIPEVYRKLQLAYEEYAKVVTDNPLAAQHALSSALISYRHIQLDEALMKLQVILRKFCKTPEAVEARDGLLVIYKARDQDEQYFATNEDFAARSCGTKEAQDQGKIYNASLRFNRAVETLSLAYSLQGEGKTAEAQVKFLDAGQQFYTIYTEMVDSDEEKDYAVYAAATAYTAGGRPKTGIALYEEITKNLKYKKESKFYVEALFYVAKAYESSFDFEKAGDLYLEFYALASQPNVKYRKPSDKDPGFNLPEEKINSLYNAAYMRELDRVYENRSRTDKGAIQLYKDYASEDANNLARGSEAYLRIAGIYEKVGNYTAMVATYVKWRKDYAKDPTTKETAVIYVKSYYKAAVTTKKLKDQYLAWQQVVDAYDYAYGKAPNGETVRPAPVDAREWAGEAAFRLAERYYKETVVPYTIKWKGNILDVKNEKTLAQSRKNFDATITAIDDMLAKAYTDFLGVARFQSTWNLAALVRIADASFEVGQKVITVKAPPEVVKFDKKYPDLDYMNGIFRAQLECRATTSYQDPDDLDRQVECLCAATFPQLDLDGDGADDYAELRDACVANLQGGKSTCLAVDAQNNCTSTTTKELIGKGINPYGAKKYWLQALDSARRNGISNEYTKIAEQRLNDLDSEKYPVQRDNIVQPEATP